MKGVIISNYFDFVKDTYGATHLETMKDKTGLKGTIILANKDYPDSKVVEAIQVTSELVGKPLNEVLHQFGLYWLPMKGVVNYGHYFKDAADAKTMFKKMDQIHKEVTQNMPGAQPPSFEYEEPAPNKLVMIYKSIRGVLLVPFLEGLIEAMGKHYNQTIKISTQIVKDGNKEIARIECTF